MNNILTRGIISLIIILSLGLVSFVSEDDQDYCKRYHVKSGVVKYKYEGKASGTKELYFDNWGMIESQFDKMTVEVFGMKQKTNNLIILHEKEISVINLDTKKAYKSESKEILSLLKFDPNEKDLVKVAEEMMKKAGGEKQANEMFLGKDCDVWKVDGVKHLSWKGIPLKIEMTMMGMEIKMIATEINTDIEIPESKFKIPQGITFVEKPEDGFTFE